MYARFDYPKTDWKTASRLWLFVLAVSVVAAGMGVGRDAKAGGGAMETKSRAEWKAEYVRPSEVPFPEENPYTADKARLGKMLFFDPRLSGSDYISCGNCHNPSFAWGDGLPKGIGHGMTRLGRRTPTILNAAWNELQMWDGRFETLEEQVLGPIETGAEMNQPMEALIGELKAIPGYRALFSVAFPEEGITEETIAKAIATYERTVVSGIAPFDRWIAGDEDAISEEAKHGFDLFNGKANCVACHSGWNFTDGSFQDIGLPDADIGRGKQFPQVPILQHAFKTPTLRNVVERGPYMHDGSLPDLAAVMRHYNDGFVQRPSLSEDIHLLSLTPEEEKALVTFMHTLSSRDEQVAFPVLPHYDQKSGSGVARVSSAAGEDDGTARRPLCGGIRHCSD